MNQQPEIQQPEPQQASPPTLGAVQEALAGVMLTDRVRLERRLQQWRHAPTDTTLPANVVADLARAQQRVARRRAAVPVITYPQNLPVVQRREEILATLVAHQVVVLAGETGSGKTTQLPKMFLELGRGVLGRIGHTQPRRIAARAVAERIAEELHTPVGSVVGHKVRFHDTSGDRTLLKVMTDGVLLAEIAHDPDLLAYDTLIIDEAHERSLTIDFLLGYLVRLLPRRPDLKVVVTSATIDPARFAAHLEQVVFTVPVIEVSGRTYPVDVRYRPLVEVDAQDPSSETVRDQVQAIVEAVDELSCEGPGDVLVFCSGEREIRDTADALTNACPPGTRILPLYGRLSAADQHRVFEGPDGSTGRRIVVATNVAETSLTVPGIRYVVDPGTARISRYSNRTKVQRLPIEPISQASADQRKGRCGRLSAGICIRLYAEQDFDARPEFTDPEILRTSLASVILAMASLGLGPIEEFPFLDPPDRRQVRDGLALLHELGAVEDGVGTPRLTPLGKRLARLPIDPQLGAMVLAAQDLGVMAPVLAIVAALSIQDPRERPSGDPALADLMHSRFREPDSDLTPLWLLWSYLRTQQGRLSSSAFRRMCKREFLHHQRVREWQDLEAQLRQALRTLRIDVAQDAAPTSEEVLDEAGVLDPALLRAQLSATTAERVHRALLAGSLGRIGVYDPAKREYQGAHGSRFVIAPGSVLQRKPPAWVMAAELVQTERLFARRVAKIEPEWVEAIAGHLVKRQYSEPHWERRRAAVVAIERVTLHGLPLVVGRRATYSTIDPVLCRELFLRHGLVEGEWDTRHRFVLANRNWLDDAADLEQRTRRPLPMLDEYALMAFYEVRVPAQVVSGRHFDAWWKVARRTEPDLLTLDPRSLPGALPEAELFAAYPDNLTLGDLMLRLSYRFEPGAPDDGVSVHVPLTVLNRVREADATWLVPGLRLELIIALIRGLPKSLRRSFVPAPDVAAAVLDAIVPAARGLSDAGSAGAAASAADSLTLHEALTRELLRRTGVRVDPEQWRAVELPEHLRLRWVVEGSDGAVLGADRELGPLRTRLAPRLAAAIAEVGGPVSHKRLDSWSIGTLPEQIVADRDGHRVEAFPALVASDSGVAVALLADPEQAARSTWAGTRALLLQLLPSPMKLLEDAGRQAAATAVRKAGPGPGPGPGPGAGPGRGGAGGAGAARGRAPSPAELARAARPAPVPGLATADRLALAAGPHADPGAALADCTECAVDALLALNGGPVRDEQAWDQLLAAVKAEAPAALAEVVGLVLRVLHSARELDSELEQLARVSSLVDLHHDLAAQRLGLVGPRFVSATGRDHLPNLVRYLAAMRRRAQTAPDNISRDADRMDQVRELESLYRQTVDQLPLSRREDPDVRDVGWLLQELRVSLFAQTIGTPRPVSAQRVLTALRKLVG